MNAKDEPTKQEKAYRFWLPILVSLLSLILGVINAYVTHVLEQKVDEEQAKPKLAQIRTLEQFPADDRARTLLLKNYSTRQDAVVTGISFLVTEKEFLDRIKKRRRFVPNAPPVPWNELILPGNQIIELERCDWLPTGDAFAFKESVDLRISPGKAETIRVMLKSPQIAPQLWGKAWMRGELTIWYDNQKLVLKDVILCEKNCPIIPDIPPSW